MRTNGSLRFLSSSPLSSTASKLEIVYDESPISAAEDESDCGSGGVDDLKSRILRLRLPKRSATNVIEKWINEGHRITSYDLRHISKELRKSHRYKHALEVRYLNFFSNSIVSAIELHERSNIYLVSEQSFLKP